MKLKHTLLLMVAVITLSSFKDEPKVKRKVKSKPCSGLIIYIATYPWNDSVMIGLELEDRSELVIKTKIVGYKPSVNEPYKFDCKLIPKVK